MLKDNLIMLRRIHGYSQEEISEKVGITRQAYAKWESGTTIPDIKKCSRLAEIYNVSIDSLMKTETIDGTEKIAPPPKGKKIWGTVAVNEKGQIVIPKEARDKFMLDAGKRMVVLSDDYGIALIPFENFEKNVRSMMEKATAIITNE